MTERLTAAEFLAEVAAEKGRRRSKFGAVAAYRCKGCDAPMTKAQPRCRVCGGTEKRFFPSRAEAKRFDLLKSRERRGEITDLRCQPAFPLEINGIRIGVYKADFAYDEAGETVVEDVKSPATMTEAATLRMKVAEAVHGIKIRKVFKGGH